MHEGEPQQVVGHPGDVPLLGQRVPPVVDRAVGELVRGVQVDLLAAARRVDRQPDLRVLELVAEAVGAALLVVAAAAPEAGRDRLVAHPVVDQHVERRLRRPRRVRCERAPATSADLRRGAADASAADRAAVSRALPASTARRPRARSRRRSSAARPQLDRAAQRRDRVVVPAERGVPALPDARAGRAGCRSGRGTRLVALRRVTAAACRRSAATYGKSVFQCPQPFDGPPPTCGCAPSIAGAPASYAVSRNSLWNSRRGDGDTPQFTKLFLENSLGRCAGRSSRAAACGRSRRNGSATANTEFPYVAAFAVHR